MAAGARGVDGQVVTYPAIENHHTGGILDWSVAPARLPAAVTDAAVRAARAVFEALDLVGVVIEAPREDPRDSVLPPKPTPSPTPAPAPAPEPAPAPAATPSASPVAYRWSRG